MAADETNMTIFPSIERNEPSTSTDGERGKGRFMTLHTAKYTLRIDLETLAKELLPRQVPPRRVETPVPSPTPAPAPRRVPRIRIVVRTADERELMRLQREMRTVWSNTRGAGRFIRAWFVCDHYREELQRPEVRAWFLDEICSSKCQKTVRSWLALDGQDRGRLARAASKAAVRRINLANQASK